MGSEEMGGVLQYQVQVLVEGVQRRNGVNVIDSNYSDAGQPSAPSLGSLLGSRESAVVAHLSTFQVRARVARRARRAHRSAHTCV